MNSNIQNMRKKRFQFLRRLFEITGGDQYRDVNMSVIGKELELSDEDTLKVAEYLKGEGYLEFVAFGGLIAITHEGIINVEEKLEQPEPPTQFPPQGNIIWINQMIGSQIQQATNDSTQKMSLSPEDLETITKFIAVCKEKLPELQLTKDSQEEAEEDISTVEKQLKLSKPKYPIIKECLKSLRCILENAAGQAVAILLLNQFPKY